MLKLFRKSEEDQKKLRVNLQEELEYLEKTIIPKRKELKFLEASMDEKLNMLNSKEQELMDLADTLGEEKAKLIIREQLVLAKEKVLHDKEDNFIKKTL